MSIKVVERMKHYCHELLVGLKHNDATKVSKWLKELEKENNEELSLAKEFSIKFLLSLHGMISEDINKIKANLNNRKDCIKTIKKTKHSLEEVVDQRKVRDEIIKEVIQPLLKGWGYKKRGRAFIKEENGYFKKLNVYTSNVCDYYDVNFTFEIYIKGHGIEHEGHRVKEKWFVLTQDIDLKKIKEEIKTHLISDIKPFLNKFR